MEPVGPSAQTRAQVDAVLAAIEAHSIASMETKDDSIRCRCGLGYVDRAAYDDHVYVQAVGAAELAVS